MISFAGQCTTVHFRRYTYRWILTRLSKTSCLDRKWSWLPATGSPLANRNIRAHFDKPSYDRNCLESVMWLQCFCNTALHWTTKKLLKDPVEWSRTTLHQIWVSNVYSKLQSNIRWAIAGKNLCNQNYHNLLILIIQYIRTT